MRVHVLCILVWQLAAVYMFIRHACVYRNVFVCVQGLFHPARKVRDVYWKVYNTVYIGAQDSLVPAYPRVPNDEKNTYLRYELDYIL